MRPMGEYPKVKVKEYPKVKVKVRQEEDDDDQFALEFSSLQSLKGFVPLFPHDSSPDDFPTSIVRIPGSSISSPAKSEDQAIRDVLPTSIEGVPESSTSTSATCQDSASKGTSTEKEMGCDGHKTSTQANLVPRARAVLSSPDNDTVIGSTNKTRKEPLSTVRNHNLCHNRHTQCKVTPPAPKGNKPPWKN